MAKLAVAFTELLVLALVLAPATARNVPDLVTATTKTPTGGDASAGLEDKKNFVFGGVGGFAGVGGIAGGYGGAAGVAGLGGLGGVGGVGGLGGLGGVGGVGTGAGGGFGGGAGGITP
ncbi:unnamed protein product [Musa acuminata subsp. malaccensis]|uniref:(wild Malaysian banana) hypothetical protein n=1 Tax=Musa acuminata subsp. malaccensis TaxID=214687 RepID=A0A804K8N4_MUSAM|nr:PREDICTED: glycine-rich cell wall structural protein-like [Musa acuminata subsp. malaccensis]CAG1832173.1 unnamed protein product [Musa acuminata subsp. malaccensis]